MLAPVTSMRVLATTETVSSLFERVNLPYDYQDARGTPQQCELPGWRCRKCGFTSFGFLHDLPLPHECGEIHRAVTTVDQVFTS